MRDEFARVVTELARERADVCLLSGDIGNRMFDSFKEAAPGRFLNCGIAEANMMSVAAGMGLNGMRPVVYTITPFITTRCLEQVRIGVAYHRAPVVIVGTGSGLSYAELGPTHHSLEDIAIMKALPGLNILAPCDKVELREYLREAVDSGEPTYIRIGKKGEPILNVDNSGIGIGKASVLKGGTDVLLLVAGPIANEALTATTRLEEMGISVEVASIGSIRPLDEDYLKMAVSRFNCWMSLEEHYSNGGVGSTILEWLNSNGHNEVSLKRLGVEEVFVHELGSQAYVRNRFRLDSEGIVESILEYSRSVI